MRDDLRDFARFDTVVEREVEMRRHLDRLVACDQRCEGDDAPVAWGEARPLPHITEKCALRVPLECRRYHSNIVS